MFQYALVLNSKVYRLLILLLCTLIKQQMFLQTPNIQQTKANRATLLILVLAMWVRSLKIKCIKHAHICASLQHIRAYHKHIGACHAHIGACHAHIRACLKHIRACHAHIRACHQHIRACHQHIRACLISNFFYKYINKQGITKNVGLKNGVGLVRHNLPLQDV